MKLLTLILAGTPRISATGMATEKKVVAVQHPDISEKIGTFLKTARSDSADWPPQWRAGKKAIQ